MQRFPNYRLAVTFRDGSSAELDCSAVVTAREAGIYQAIADAKVFEQVGLDLGVITWPNGADLDPAWIYEATRSNTIWAVPF